MPIFRVKSVKMYTGQKKFTRTCPWRPWQISGMLNLLAFRSCCWCHDQKSGPFNFWLKTFFLLQRWHRHRLSDGPLCHGDVRQPCIWRVSMGDGQNRKSNALILSVQKSKFFEMQSNVLESSNSNITTHKKHFFILCCKTHVPFISLFVQVKDQQYGKIKFNVSFFKTWIILTMKCFQSLIYSKHLVIGHSWMPQWCRIAGSSLQGRFFHNGEVRPLLW